MAKRRTINDLTDAELSLPRAEIDKLLGRGQPSTPRKAAPRKAARRPIGISSEDQIIRESAQQAARVRDGGGKRTAPSASRTSGASTVNLSRSSPRPAPRAKAMSRTGTGSVPSSKAGGGKPIVRTGSGGLSLRGGTRGAWRRDSKGRFS